MNEELAAERKQDVRVKQSGEGDPPTILEEIVIEDLAVDGICGVY